MISSAYTLIKRPQVNQPPVQRKDASLPQAKSTGLPDSLRSGLEKLQSDIQPGTSGKDVVQRKINWTEGPRVKNRNLAIPFLRQYDFGLTPVILNSTTIDGYSGIDSSDLIKGPAFEFEKENGKEGGTLRIAREAENRVGYTMELPSAPPWQSPITPSNAYLNLKGQGFKGVEKALLHLDEKDDIRNKDKSLLHVTEKVSEKDTEESEEPEEKLPAQITVDANGLPDSGAFANLVEVHEDHHVEDLKNIRDEVLKPWDEFITTAKLKDFSLQAATLEEGKEEFYKNAGATPRDISERFYEELEHRGKSFHKTKEGDKPSIGYASLLNRVLYIGWKHPLG